MSNIVRAGLVQQKWTGDKDSMTANAVDAIRSAASQGAQVVCLQELFYGPYFCQIQDADYYSYTEAIPDVVLFRSELGAGGARHVALARYPIG